MRVFNEYRVKLETVSRVDDSRIRLIAYARVKTKYQRRSDARWDAYRSNFHGDASLEKRSVVVADICHQLSHPSLSVAINIPLCCLSQNYRNSRRTTKMVGEQRDRRTTKPNSRQFATRIESQTPFNAFRDSSIPP